MGARRIGFAARRCRHGNFNRLLTIHTANSAHLKRRHAAQARGEGAMAINDIPALAALRTKMQWHQERQRVLAENVANSDTPSFKPRDLVDPKIDVTSGRAGPGPLAMVRTSTSHIIPSGAPESFDQNSKVGFETRPTGNAVNLEDEMLKAADNQMDYAAVTSLYSSRLHLLKVAIGKA
jgi:flagellar basal-body rod protein FlgB